MNPHHAQKADYTEQLRQHILQQVADAQETERAEASFTALSYQSRVYPNRHIWIETDEDGMSLDLEDWTIQNTENQVVQSLDIGTLDETVTQVNTWLSGFAVTHKPLFTIHAIRDGHHVLLSEDEFSTLIQQFLTYQPVEVIEEHVQNVDDVYPSVRKFSHQS